MAYWLLKTEPSTYSFAMLVRDKRTTWDGVSNPVALKNIRQMKNGDVALIYHTGDEKQIVGLAKIASDPYPDPRLGDPKRVVIDLTPGQPVARPVTLARVKADSRFTEFALVRQSRLSVMPVTLEQWKTLLEMAAEPER